MIDVGQQVGGYTILKRIGRGGMGEVFLAQHRRVARRAAVKVLVPELSQKASVLDRFFNEARATSTIRHPGIVEIVDCDVLEGQAFIIMEFLDGESLGAYLERVGPLHTDLPFLLGVGIAVAAAVGAAHTAGIIHRDLKPDNVYLHLPADHDATVIGKILDFGIAKLVEQEHGISQTSTGMLLGTPAYMSPEQCRGARNVDGRSDVYSLGCILYQALCGAPPFSGEGMGDLIVAHVSEAPVPLVERVATIPPEVNAVILKMLAKKPVDRQPSMESVVGELTACASQLGVALEPMLRPRQPVERSVRIPADLPGSSPSFSSRRASTPTPSGPSSTPAPASPSQPGETLVEPVASSADPGVPALEGSGGTRILQSKAPTTLGSSVGEIQAQVPAPPPPAPETKAVGATFGRALWRRGVLGIPAVAIAVVVGLVISRKETPPPQPTAATRGNEVRLPAPIALPITKPAPAPPSAPAADELSAGAKISPAGANPPEDSVTVTILGLTPEMTLTVDGRVAAAPLRFARGTKSHKVVVGLPGGRERPFEVDGSQDRSIDLGPDAANRVHPAEAAKLGPRESPEKRSAESKIAAGGEPLVHRPPIKSPSRPLAHPSKAPERKAPGPITDL